MKLVKRFCSLLLVLAMLCTVTPMGMTVFAEEAVPEETVTIEFTPEETGAEETAPEETVPEETIPEETAPEAETEPLAGEGSEELLTPEIAPVVETGEIPIQVNPLYEGTVDPGSYQLPERSENRADASIQANPTYLTMSNAIEEFREYMVERTETFTIYVSSSSYDVNSVFEELLTGALVHTGNAKEGDYLMWQFGTYGAYYDRVLSGDKCHYTFEVTITYYTTATQEIWVDYYVDNLITKLGIRNKSDYKKVQAVYEWMCDNITYDYENLSDSSYLLKHTAYAAIANKTAVCQGYALLFYRIMLELGVDCRLIAGIGGEEAHGWNIVELDGLYYNVDTTWDAGMEEYQWFLNNTWNFVYHYRYLEYETMEFHTAYPMAAEDYVEGVKGEMDPFIYGGYCGDEAIWLLSRYGEIYITGSGPMYDYDNSTNGMPDWQYLWADYITYVAVDEGITRIGNYSFDDLSNLTTVILYPGVQEIGQNAFSGCFALSEVELNEGLTHIGNSAFSNCTSLSGISIPDSVIEIGNGAFAACGLTKVILPDNMTAIGSTAFARCSVLTSIGMPEHLDSLGYGAFQYCSALLEIYIPDGITTIEGATFERCTNLASVRLPATLQIIDDYAFAECSSLSTLELPEGLTDIGENAFCRSGISGIVIPEGVTTIKKGAFSICEELEYVSLPQSLTRIEEEAFWDCESLKEIVLPNQLISIGEKAFCSCTSLTSVTIPGSVTSIGQFAFSACTSITNVVLSEGITAVCHGMFNSCTALKNINLPSTLQRIEYQAFNGCKSLENITFPAGLASIGSIAFINCSSLKEINFEGSAPGIQSDAFSSVVATAYYPPNDETWTDDILQNYGGTITWIVACDHVYEPLVTAPTCTEQGYTTYTCTFCGDSYVRDYTDIVPHTAGEVQTENVVPATCSAAGSYDEATYCTMCGMEMSRNTVATDMLPHTEGEVQTENVVPATCAAAGSYDEATYCTVCGAEMSRETIETEMLPHTYSAVITEPTCAKDGYTSHICTACGDSYTDTSVPALGHVYSYELTDTPSQVSTGALTGTCAQCADELTVVLPKLSDEDYTHIVTKEPTDTENGTAEYTWNNTDYGVITFEVKLRKLSGLPLGDLNDDGNVDIFDANLVAAYYNEVIELDVDQLSAADVNGDGLVDIFDANLIAAYYNEAIDEFPL